MEARASPMALSSPLMTSSHVWEGEAGIHVVRPGMGSNPLSTASVHLSPMSPECEKRAQSLANL
eukprot:6791225-Pyramimonas_sp.AAC.1